MRFFVKCALAAYLACSIGLAAEAADLPEDLHDGLMCSPSVLHPSSVLKVDIAVPHGGTLAIEDPDGRYFLIAFDQPDHQANVQPMIPDAIFSKIASLSLPVSTISGFTVASNISKPSRVFNKEGIYTLYVSPQIETDDPIIEGWCKLSYNTK